MQRRRPLQCTTGTRRCSRCAARCCDKIRRQRSLSSGATPVGVAATRRRMGSRRRSMCAAWLAVATTRRSRSPPSRGNALAHGGAQGPHRDWLRRQQEGGGQCNQRQRPPQHTTGTPGSSRCAAGFGDDKVKIILNNLNKRFSPGIRQDPSRDPGGSESGSWRIPEKIPGRAGSRS